MTETDQPRAVAEAERVRDDVADAPAGSEVRLSVVVPAHNEAGNLRPLVEELCEVLASPEMEPYRPAEVVLVDDGSTDGSRGVMRELADEHPSVQAVFLRRKFGQTPALAAGIGVAMGEYVVTMDGDLQNNPKDIPALLDRLAEGYDCVSGWRQDRKDSLAKKIPSWIQTYLARLTGPDIHDFGCTLTAYRSGPLKDIDLHGEGHRYIPAKLYKRGYRITEVPVDHRRRASGETKYGAPRLLNGFVDLLFHILWNRFSTRPMHLLGGTGVVLMAVGFLLGGHAVFMKYVLLEPLTPHLPRLILIVALVLFGIQLFMFGFLAELLAKVYYRSSSEFRIESVYRGSAS